jgi:hypothetical protein
MLDAKQRGATDEQALTMGLLAGYFEMLVDKHGVGRLLDTKAGLPESEGELLERAINKTSGEWIDGKTTNIANSLVTYIVIGENSNYKENIRYYLEEHPDWNYEQAERQALLNAALKAAEADVDKWSSLIFPSQKKVMKVY